MVLFKYDKLGRHETEKCNKNGEDRGRFHGLFTVKISLLASFVVVIFQLKLMNQSFTYLPYDDHITSKPIKSSRRGEKPTVLSTVNHSPNERNLGCPFRNSSIVESIYVYPHPGSSKWKGDILSEYANNNKNENHSSNFDEYPWIINDRNCKASGIGPYESTSQLVQYNTELLIRDIINHPDSCLRTDDPEKATLFYVPYLPSAEFHNGTLFNNDMGQTKYGKAIQDIITEDKYDLWERTFGLTSKYWKRRNGSDHILVYSEPMHGLWHPKSRRGNFHFLHSQFQTHSPIAISNELSKTFIDMYPMCARKNILMPYPNTNGRWFNGALNEEAITMTKKHEGIQQLSDSPAAIKSELELSEIQGTITNHTMPLRLLGYFYSGGNHGTCSKLRRNMQTEFKCSPSGKMAQRYKKEFKNYAHGYRQSTFCPCPGGDSPSAKRNFDAVLAGCIPVVLSEDFVWPFTSEFDRSYGTNRTEGVVALNPADFSIRLRAQDHEDAIFDSPATCNRTDAKTSLQSVLESVSSQELARLRKGVAQAAEAYSYYQMRPNLPDNPLREGVLPDGGAAHMLVRALEERASGKLWHACREELKSRDISKDPVRQFKC